MNAIGLELHVVQTFLRFHFKIWLTGMFLYSLGAKRHSSLFNLLEIIFSEIIAWLHNHSCLTDLMQGSQHSKQEIRRWFSTCPLTFEDLVEIWAGFYVRLYDFFFQVHGQMDGVVLDMQWWPKLSSSLILQYVAMHIGQYSSIMIVWTSKQWETRGEDTCFKKKKTMKKKCLIIPRCRGCCEYFSK